MSMIQVSNLTFYYEGSYDNIFEDVSFQMDTNWRLGLIGRNGRGKTTFLKLLLGNYEYRGNIISSVQFDYFPYPIQSPSLPAMDAVREAAFDFPDWALLKETAALSVDPDTLYRPFSTLSPGEQTKIMLAALFLWDSHFLLIDEPTNHLDALGRESVSRYLRSKCGFILASHDRAFLDTAIDHVLSINRSKIEVQKGNYSSWQENKDRQDAFEREKNERLKQEIGQLQESARRTANWSEPASPCPMEIKLCVRRFRSHSARETGLRSPEKTALENPAC